MSTNTTPRILGALPAPAWHRPWLRYIDPVDGAEVTPPPAEPTDPPADPTDPPAPTDPAAEEKPPWGDDFDADRAWKRIQAQKADLEAERKKREKAIKDAEAAAAQKAREETYREFGKQLGIVKDDEAPTVESLSTSLQERDQNLSSTQAALAAQRAENAVLRVAGTVNADADALLDSRGFTEKLAAVDPTADDYASQVEALVKAEVESNARYRKVQVAPKSSNGDPAPAGGNPAPEGIESMRKSFADRRADGA